MRQSVENFENVVNVFEKTLTTHNRQVAVIAVTAYSHTHVHIFIYERGNNYNSWLHERGKREAAKRSNVQVPTALAFLHAYVVVVSVFNVFVVICIFVFV